MSEIKVSVVIPDRTLDEARRGEVLTRAVMMELNEKIGAELAEGLQLEGRKHVQTIGRLDEWGNAAGVEVIMTCEARPSDEVLAQIAEDERADAVQTAAELGAARRHADFIARYSVDGDAFRRSLMTDHGLLTRDQARAMLQDARAVVPPVYYPESDELLVPPLPAAVPPLPAAAESRGLVRRLRDRRARALARRTRRREDEAIDRQMRLSFMSYGEPGRGRTALLGDGMTFEPLGAAGRGRSASPLAYLRYELEGRVSSLNDYVSSRPGALSPEETGDVDDVIREADALRDRIRALEDQERLTEQIGALAREPSEDDVRRLATMVPVSDEMLNDWRPDPRRYSVEPRYRVQADERLRRSRAVGRVTGAEADADGLRVTAQIHDESFGRLLRGLGAPLVPDYSAADIAFTTAAAEVARPDGPDYTLTVGEDGRQALRWRGVEFDEPDLRRMEFRQESDAQEITTWQSHAPLRRLVTPGPLEARVPGQTEWTSDPTALRAALSAACASCGAAESTLHRLSCPTQAGLPRVDGLNETPWPRPTRVERVEPWFVAAGIPDPHAGEPGRYIDGRWRSAAEYNTPLDPYSRRFDVNLAHEQAITEASRAGVSVLLPGGTRRLTAAQIAQVYGIPESFLRRGPDRCAHANAAVGDQCCPQCGEPVVVQRGDTVDNDPFADWDEVADGVEAVRAYRAASPLPLCRAPGCTRAARDPAGGLAYCRSHAPAAAAAGDQADAYRYLLQGDRAAFLAEANLAFRVADPPADGSIMGSAS